MWKLSIQWYFGSSPYHQAPSGSWREQLYSMAERATLSIFAVASMFRRSGEHGRTEHIGIMNRALDMGKVADTISLPGLFPRQVHDPAANSIGDFQPTHCPGHFVGLQIREPDERRPNNDRIVLGVSSAPAGKVEMVAPTVLRNFAAL